MKHCNRNVFTATDVYNLQQCIFRYKTDWACQHVIPHQSLYTHM